MKAAEKKVEDLEVLHRRQSRMLEPIEGMKKANEKTAVVTLRSDPNASRYFGLGNRLSKADSSSPRTKASSSDSDAADSADVERSGLDGAKDAATALRRLERSDPEATAELLRETFTEIAPVLFSEAVDGIAE